MVEIIHLNNDEISKEAAFLETAQGLLLDARVSLDGRKNMSIPIGKLSALGAGVSTLIPAFNAITQTTSFAAENLYTLANKGMGDVLKVAKNGNFWGAFKTADGASKFAQLQSADSISATTQTAAAFNPAILMMAVALFSIEQELGKIEDMQKRIISFLEIEKESEVEADVESLMGIIRKYKDNWDNEYFVNGNHNQVLTYQNRARKNMLGYQKKISEILGKKQLIVSQSRVKQAFSDLEKKFKYYRLSLYTFSFSSLLEIMLSGNFKESYISSIKKEIVEMSEAYRSLFDKSSSYLEKMSKSALEANLLNGAGAAGNAVGKLIGGIPLIKEGPVDELLQDGGLHLKKNAAEMKELPVHRFAALSNPGTHVFTSKMDDMIQIYNHTDRICFDKQRIYLLSDKTA